MARVYKSEQAVVYNYIRNSGVVPKCSAVEEYAKSTYDMRALCADIHRMCNGMQVSSYEFALVYPDVFMSLMKKHDVSDTALLDILWSNDSISIQRVDEGDILHPSGFNYIWLHLHIDIRQYGHIGKISTTVWEYPSLVTHRFVLLTDKGYFVLPHRGEDLWSVSGGVLHVEWRSDDDGNNGVPCNLFAHVIKSSEKSDV